MRSTGLVMEFRRSLPGIACLALSCAGCSRELQVQPLQSSPGRVGIAYVLPFTQYQITESWSLDYCPDAAHPDPQKGTEPKISVKVEATPSAADDGDLAFVVNPQDLQTLTNVTAFGAKWFDGRNMLSSINASSEDRTAQIIGNLTKTALKILPLAMGSPAAPVAAGQVIECEPAMVQALANAKTAKATLEAANDLVEGRTAEVTRLGAKVQQQGINVDEATKKSLGDAIDLLVQAKATQADAAEALVKTMKPITFSRKITWPLDGNTFSHGPDRLPAPVVQRWLGANAGRVEARPIYLQIERAGSFGRIPPRPNLTPDSQDVIDAADERMSPLAPEPNYSAYSLPDSRVEGLRYRMPAAGRLVACFRSPCGSADLDGVIASFDSQIVQLGYVNVLPFRGQAFGHNSFSAEFAENGSLKSAAYDQKSAPGEAASGALADSAGQFSDALNPTARATAKASYLKALKEQRDAYEALQADPNSAAAAETASLGADTALLNARIAKLNAEIALAELQAKAAGN